MKTIVLVSIPGSVLSLDLSDFPTGGPVEGRKYEFDGKLYKVAEVTETLGCRGLLGNKISGDTRLLSFADAVSHGDEVLKLQIIKPKRVGEHAPEDVRTAGGIIIGQTEEKPTLETSGSEQLHIVFVKAVPAESSTGGVRLPQGVRLQSLVGPADGAQGLLDTDAGEITPKDELDADGAYAISPKDVLDGSTAVEIVPGN